MTVKEVIANLLAKEIKLKEEEILKLLEVPQQSEMGDFAFPCFKLSAILKKNPIEIAKTLAGKLKERVGIDMIKANGPYLNFFIDKKIIARQAININESFGRDKQDGKILLEHTSINPNASPHVGRTRNSIIGDSIYRILTFLGNKVERHYYVNDVSKQIAILALYFNPKDKFEDLLEKYVKGSKAVEKDVLMEERVFKMLNKFEHKDKETVELFKKIVEIAIEGQKKVLDSIGINFDYFDYESRYIESQKEILRELENTGKLFKDRENRLVLNQKGTGLECKMKAPYLVLTRNDGTGLYILRDLAYTIDKCKKGRNIIILGEDQKLYFEQLKHTLILLKKPCPEAVHYSFVLIKGRGKMSTRSGEVVLLEELLKEALKKAKSEIKSRKTKGDAMKIAIAAIKYSMLRNDNNKNILFDMESSLNFEGDTGPYLQYSYARANSILNKVSATKKKSDSEKKIEIPNLTEEEIKLAKKITEFPAIVKESGENLNPSLLANYSFHLAQLFNEFYHACPVISNKEEAFRLKLVKSFKITIKNSLYLLGIDTMEEM